MIFTGIEFSGGKEMHKRYLLLTILLLLFMPILIISCGEPQNQKHITEEIEKPTQTEVPSFSPSDNASEAEQNMRNTVATIPDIKESPKDTQALLGGPQYFASDDWSFSDLSAEFTTTPNAELILIKKSEIQHEAESLVVYNLRTEGMFEHSIYKLWLKRAWEKSPNQVQDGFLISSDGYVTKGGSPVNIVFGGYTKGESAVLVLFNDDKTRIAACKIIPVPVETRLGNYHIWMEMVAKDNTIHAIYAEGFDPNEEILYSSTSEGEIINSDLTVDENGRFTIVLLPAVIGKNSGTVNFNATGKMGTIGITFDWGSNSE